MSFALALALLTAPLQAAPAPSFAARVTRGRLVEAGPHGADYQKRLWAAMNDPTTAALKQCLASHAPADKSPFTVVADVLPDGTPRLVDVQPPTPVARCLADWFATVSLPPPPMQPGESSYPIEIDFSIVP